MSELRETIKRATLTFAHASDFIVSLYEGAYTIAEDLSDRIAEERKLYQAPLLKQIEIENEIGAMVSFTSKILPAFLIAQIALLEDWILEICQIAAQQESISYAYDPSIRFTLQQAKFFFEQKMGIQFPDPWPVWERLLEFERLRDEAVTHTGLDVGQINLSDSFLVDINKTIVSYLEELKTYLPEPLE